MLKRIQMLVLSVLAGVLGLAGATTPAAAAYTSLCSGYSGCAAAEMSDSGYGKVNSAMYWRMTAGHNCTNYVAYRLIQDGMSATRPWTGSGMAYNWGIANAAITDQKPAVGAVAWYAAHRSPIGASGHVQYVERVVSDDEIIVSEDNWGGTFHWRRVARASSWPSGFIHFATTPPVTSGTTSPQGVVDRAWSPTPGQVSVSGWAVDTDALKTALAVSVSVGGKAGARGAESHRLGTADAANGTVGYRFPGAGDRHGLAATLTTAKRGSQPVYVYAGNATGTPGHKVLLGTATVTIADPDPSGKVSLVSSPRSHRLHLKGWAVDPNTPKASVRVRAYVGGPAGKGHRIELGLAARSSAAAATAVPGAGTPHGFDVTVKSTWTGKRTVYVYARNLTGTPGAQHLIGKRTLTIKK